MAVSASNRAAGEPAGTWRTDMADELDASTTGKANAFNRMYFFILAGLIVLVLGLYLFFAATRQSHGATSGAGTQKGMIVHQNQALSS